MKNLPLFTFALLLFANCGNTPNPAQAEGKMIADITKQPVLSHWTTEEPKNVSRIVETDTIIKAFGERFKMVCRENAGKDAENNDVLTITNLKTKKIIAQDTLNLNYNLQFERKDYNKDGVKDIQLYSYSGARSANSMYYLYISDVPNKTFHFVTDFNTEPSPEADTSGMVIYHAYYGDTENHRFYKIMPNYCMEDIGYNVETHFAYACTPQGIKEEQQNEKAYRKAYNKAWAKFKKMK